MAETIGELINRRRRQILVHSCLYYRLDTNIIDDHTYDSWSKELTQLQRDYPEISSTSVYASEFADFDGSSGFDLPTHYPEVMSKAMQLLRIESRR